MFEIFIIIMGMANVVLGTIMYLEGEYARATFHLVLGVNMYQFIKNND